MRTVLIDTHMLVGVKYVPHCFSFRRLYSIFKHVSTPCQLQPHLGDRALGLKCVRCFKGMSERGKIRFRGGEAALIKHTSATDVLRGILLNEASPNVRFHTSDSQSIPTSRSTVDIYIYIYLKSELSQSLLQFSSSCRVGPEYTDR